MVLIAAVWFSSKPRQFPPASKEDNTQPQKTQIRYKAPLPNSPAEKTKGENQPESEKMIIHTVEKNQTLSGISKLYYGTSEYVPLIIENNEIENPDEIKPGMKLKIPPRP